MLASFEVDSALAIAGVLCTILTVTPSRGPQGCDGHERGMDMSMRPCMRPVNKLTPFSFVFSYNYREADLSWLTSYALWHAGGCLV